MNISNFCSNHKILCGATLGLAVLGYIGYHAVKWILEKIGLTIRVDETARNVIQNLTESSQSQSSKMERSISVSGISKPIEKLENRRLSLIDDNFPKGVTQYYYPKLPEGENIPQACSFFSATFALYMKDHFATVAKNCHEGNIDLLINMRKAIIDQGLLVRAQALKAGMPDMANHPHHLKDFTDAFASLKIGNASEVVTGDGGFGNIDEEFDRLFSAKDLNSHPYCIVQADGQTFAFCHINQNQAFLFDSHKSWFAVVSREKAKEYLTEEILHLKVNPTQGIDFYHGTL